MKKRLSVLLLLLAGCVQPVGPAPDVPAPLPATSGCWSALADRIEAGKVKDTDELVRIAKELVSDGDVRAADFDTALPGITAKNEPLTGAKATETAKALRAIK